MFFCYALCRWESSPARDARIGGKHFRYSMILKGDKNMEGKKTYIKPEMEITEFEIADGTDTVYISGRQGGCHDTAVGTALS